MNRNRQHLPVHYGRRVMATVFMMGAVFVGGRCLIHAGEAIIVPGEKSKAAPVPENRPLAPREIFRLQDNAPLDVFGMSLVPDQPRRLDPKEEKRRRLQALEKKNWMVVNPGELQAEEDKKNFLNARDYDAFEKDDQGANLMFRPIKGENRHVPSQLRSSPDSIGGSQERQANQREKAPPAPADDDNDGPSPRKDPQLGAHISSELNFKSMFEARQNPDSLTPKFNKSDLLQTLLNSGPPPETTREQQARREEFRNFLNTPKTFSPLAGGSDPINSRGDLTRQPLNPTFPQQPFGGESANRPSPNPFGVTPNTARPIPGLAGFDSPRDSGFPAAQPWAQDNSRSWQKPTTFDPPVPKRKF